mmetsp:Transcript_60926/g.125535  ORF Transcript_60926/g.125535 Transcript_60926/m.125535 type:complete len:685 (+) Transcript_60926:1329-3383(+)
MAAQENENDKNMPLMKGSDATAFTDYETRLKKWLWVHGGNSFYTIEEDPAFAALFRPAVIPANLQQFKNDQMTLFQCLTHAFQTKHSEILRQEQNSVARNPALVTTFASNAFQRIKAAYQTRNFASAQREVDKLLHLYSKFDGNPKPYFEAINVQVHKVSTFGPDYVQPNVNIVHGIARGIMGFAMREGATPPEKTWSDWVVGLQSRTPAAMLNVALFETEATSHYDVYCNVKVEFERMSGKKSEMGAFMAWDEKEKRRREESESPERGRSRERDRDYKRRREDSYGRGRAPPRRTSRSPGRPPFRKVRLDRRGDAEPPIYDCNGELIACHNCGRNHFKSDCPSKKREDSRDRDRRGSSRDRDRGSSRERSRGPSGYTASSPSSKARSRSRSKDKGEQQGTPEGMKPIHPQAALHSRIAIDTRAASRNTAAPRHVTVPVSEFHWGLVNIINPVFDHSLVLASVRATYQSRVCRVTENHHNAMLAMQTLPPCPANEMWAVVDCGATHHYHPTRLFMARIQEIDVLINGLTGPGPRATGFGLFLGILEAYDKRDRKHDKFFSSVSYHVPESTLPLFSEVQAAFSDCCIVRQGHPEHGHHGIYLTGADSDMFVPYTFEKTSLLWWIKIKQAPEATCLRASAAMDPAQAPCQLFMRAHADAATAAIAVRDDDHSARALGDPRGILKSA